MPSQQLIDFVNVYGGIISLVVGVLATALSILFFVLAKKAEKDTAILLETIKGSVDTLKSINDGLLLKAFERLANSNDMMMNKITDLLYENKIREYVSTPSSADESKPSKPSPEEAPTSSESTKDVRLDILNSIRILEKSTGRALSLELFNFLAREYAFEVILGELMRMGNEKILKWPEFPSPPGPHSRISINAA
jgi:hypothetical protein